MPGKGAGWRLSRPAGWPGSAAARQPPPQRPPPRPAPDQIVLSFFERVPCSWLDAYASQLNPVVAARVGIAARRRQPIAAGLVVQAEQYRRLRGRRIRRNVQIVGVHKRPAWRPPV